MPFQLQSFTIQNVSIKSKVLRDLGYEKIDLQYKMFLLNICFLREYIV